MSELNVVLYHALPDEQTEEERRFEAALEEVGRDFHSTERWVERQLDLEPPRPGTCGPSRPRTTGTIKPTAAWYTPEGVLNSLQHWWFDKPRVDKGMDIIALVVSEVALEPAIQALALRALGWTGRYVNLSGHGLLHDRVGFHWRLYTHGGKGGKFWAFEDGDWQQLTVQTVADALERAGYHGGRIRAYMCRGGAVQWGANPPLQQLATELERRGHRRVVVEAHTRLIRQWDLKPAPDGQWVAFRPRR